MADIIRQKSLTDSQLEEDGFKQYPRKKELVMARQLDDSEVPLEIKTEIGRAHV